MANYNQLKNAAILTPTTNQDLGTDSNRYGNVYMTGNIVMSNGVTVTSTNVIAPKISSLTLPGTETAVDIAGGETVIITGSGFSNSGGAPTVTIGSTPASSVTYNSSTSITITTPALSTGTYFLYVVNADGGTATYAPGISFSGTPVWTTASGSIGTVGSGASANLSVAATGDPTITYAVKAGSSLPSGLSLNTSTGAITGTAPSVGSQTTYNFTLTALDGQNQTTDRSFSITVAIAPTSVQYMLIAGGGGGGGRGDVYGGGGGGAGGYISSITSESSGGGASAVSALSVSSGAVFTVTIGAGGTSGGGGEESPGNTGSNSSISGSSMSTLTALGGGGGGGNSLTGKNGGSGGGGGNTPGTGTTGQGYAGGNPSGGLTGGGGGGGAGGVGSQGENGIGGIGVKTGVLLFTGTASIASNTSLTITAVSAGSIRVGTQVTGTGIPAGTYIIALGTGTGGVGTYTMNAAATATNTGVAITSTGRYHAGGGGGATSGAGGAGGGGGGSNNVAGAANTGGGGSNYLGVGGSGVVFIIYSSTYPALTSTTGSPTYTVENGYNVYRFTASGSFTI